VGREILARLIVPGLYLTVRDRGRMFSSARACARARVVNLRTRDMVLRERDIREEDIGIDIGRNVVV